MKTHSVLEPPNATDLLSASASPLETDTQPVVLPRASRLPPAWMLVAGGVGLLLIVAAVGLTLWAISRTRTTPVVVVIDGEAYPRQTRALTAADLLLEMGIAPGGYDQVSLPLDTPVTADLLVRVDRARRIVLMVDGTAQTLYSPIDNPADILASLGVTYSDEDLVIVDGTRATADMLGRWPVPVGQITVRHAMTFLLEEANNLYRYRTTAATVGEALYQAGVDVHLADVVTPPLSTPLTDGLQARLQRAQSVRVVTDGDTIVTYAQGGTAADALASAGVALMGLDYTTPSENTLLTPDMEVRVVRVKEMLISETQPLPFQTIIQADPALEIDQQAITQEGQEGLLRTLVRVRYEDGIEIGREPAEQIVVRPPRDRIIAYGTNVIMRVLDTPEGQVEYWRQLRVYATSYHPAALNGDSTTATGQTLQHGIVGADTDVLPMGTRVYVPGYGVGVVADTGAERHDPMWIDLGYSDADWRSWSSYVDVYVLTPPPDPIDYWLP